ncbi:MAG: 2-oxoglutarate dehydrogenase E1 component [Gammaproteobacteria bacterium]|nr:MAG: 2-oxoglutarate dehydrogenase E1 component [Gammaproteobacteria bacterium]
MDSRVKQNGLKELWDSSALAGANASYLEQLYDLYLEDKNNVAEKWRHYFDSLLHDTAQPAFTHPDSIQTEQSHEAIREQFRHVDRLTKKTTITQPATSTDEKQVKVLQLINAHRFRGHQCANVNPFGQESCIEVPELTLGYYQLSNDDLNTVFNTGSLVGPANATLSEILTIIESTYRGSIGAEYMHITDTSEKRWIQDYLEGRQGKPGYAKEIKHELLKQLIAAEGLEQHLHIKYVGQKRFSLEGGESLIPMLKGLILRAGDKHEVKEIAIGMAHRGRLNVLVNIMGKTPEELFMEFEGKNNNTGTGDVKYHMGFSSDLETPGGAIHLSLAFNPSHLEIVGPVVEGSVRARQDRRKDKEGKKVLPVLIHGDAAFAGQGINMETINMSQSRGYSTKGTVHIVINNQIGFTTSNQEDARSTLYCSDVAKMVNAPIFHVNGDDPESVLLVTQLALDYRMKYCKDVVIDMVCYRRHGHSEADEPMATQPVMYKNIKKMQTTRQVYANKLLKEKTVLQHEIEELTRCYREALESAHSVVPELIPANEKVYSYVADWSDYKGKDYQVDVETKLNGDVLAGLCQQLEIIPEGFELHPTVKKIMDSRKKMAKGESPVDWGFAETMAYASLLMDGFDVRLSGQDSGRGTFFHRHAVLYNQTDNSTYVPLRNIKGTDHNFLVINSLLSEAAVLAFEYGYTTTEPNTLTIWEAQFGDFANNAQVVIDQFISAGEQKWNRLSGLVMFLPHGLEGQGPEHSSARLERYLQLCAQHNMQVCVPTNAAQIFHLLRRQMLMKCRRPLIVMTPKSLLRHPVAASEFIDLTDGNFKMVIPEVDELDDEKVTRVILCSGKIYYDLVDKRRKEQRNDVAIIRIEQLYPFPDELTREQLNRYPNADKFIWCQEEPMNQGAWYSSQHHMRRAIGKNEHYLEYVGRPMLAAPAVGNMALHKKQLQDLLNEALA